MGLLDLPPELLTHIMHHLDVVGVWQLTLCCKVLAELGLSSSVLSALVRGYRSPLLRLTPSTDPAQLHLQGRRDLLRTELDSSLGRLDNKSVSKALALHVRSLNSRFEASVSEKIAQVWDRYTGELLVTEPLQTCSGLVFLQPVWSGDALYLTDTCLIIARASSSKLPHRMHRFHQRRAEHKKTRQPGASYYLFTWWVDLRNGTWQNLSKL